VSDIDNSTLIKLSLSALCKVAVRRTSGSFATKVINSIILSFRKKYGFLNHINFTVNNEIISNDFIKINSNVNSYSTKIVCKGIEAIIRVIYLDLQTKAGLYFIKEFKENAGFQVISILEENGIDIDLLEYEQNHLFQHQKQKKSIDQEVSLLGYSWIDVSRWRYDANNDVCILYDKNGKELDKLNLNVIIKNHINSLSGMDDLEFEDDKITDKDIKLLNLLNNQDLNIDSATEILGISDKELDQIIHRLLRLEILHFTDLDVVSITDKGRKYILTNKRKLN
jgi:hypothetical protein